MRKAIFLGLVLALLPIGVAHADQPYYRVIQNERTGKCVDVPGYDRPLPGGPVTQYTCRGANDNQVWYFGRHGYEVDEQGRHEVVSVVNVKGLCLDLPYFGSVPPGTRVTTYDCLGQDDNQFFVKRYRPAGGFWLVHQKSRLCLDVDGFGTGGDDAPLTLWHCSDSDDHVWRERYPGEFPAS